MSIEYGPASICKYGFNQEQNKQYMAKFWNNNIEKEFIALKKDLISQILKKIKVKIEYINPYMQNGEMTLWSLEQYINTQKNNLLLIGFGSEFKEELRSQVYSEIITKDNYYLLFHKLRCIELKLKEYKQV